MHNIINIDKRLKPFKKTIKIEGDKSLSIRWALIASQANGKSIATNLLKSEDVLSTLQCLKKLGVKSKFNHNKCEIDGVGLNGFNYKKKKYYFKRWKFWNIVKINIGSFSTLKK